jgi:hypothetical protein
MRGAGRATFAAVLLLIAGVLNIIYGIGALDSANIFVNDTRYIFSNLNTLGWVLIVLGLIQLTGGFSLLAGNTYGRVPASVRSGLCCRSAATTRGGRSPSSPSASTSFMASSCSERTSARWRPEPAEDMTHGRRRVP